MAMFLMFSAGVIFGTLFTRLMIDVKSISGVFEIIKTDSEEATCRVGISSLEGIENKKYIMLEINHNSHQ